MEWAVILAVLGIAGAAVTLWLAGRSEKQADKAEESARQALEIIEDLRRALDLYQRVMGYDEKPDRETSAEDDWNKDGSEGYDDRDDGNNL